MTEHKFCIDCKYISPSLNFCKNPKNGFSLVTGKGLPRLAQLNRSDDYYGKQACGTIGKWWESGDEPPSTSIWQKAKTYFGGV